MLLRAGLCLALQPSKPSPFPLLPTPSSVPLELSSKLQRVNSALQLWGWMYLSQCIHCGASIPDLCMLQMEKLRHRLTSCHEGEVGA